MAFGIRVGRGVLVAVSGGVITTLLGCNAILGIDKGHLVEDGDLDASAGGRRAGSGGKQSASGGKENGGAGGGATPDAGAGGGAGTGGGDGSGGKAAGGSTATGGTAGATDGGNTPAPHGVADQVGCGTETCTLKAGEVCCVSNKNGEAHCSKSCDGTLQQKWSCDGAEDCAAGKCCLPLGSSVSACAATCTGRVFCGGDGDCAPGQACRAGTSATLQTVGVCNAAPKVNSLWCGGSFCDISAGKVCCYSKTAKEEQCVAASACPAGPDKIRFTCDGTEDCVAGVACCLTRNGLGQGTGTACTPGGCPAASPEIKCGGANGCTAGESCCLSNAGSSCAASCAAQTVCGTDADCTGASAPSCTVVTDVAVGQPTGFPVCAAP